MSFGSFVWGIESWEIGVNEFTIRFKSANPKILFVKGTVTAAPQPNHQPVAQLIRQTLITLVNVGSPAEAINIETISSPSSRANHSLSNHLFSLNIKQLNSDAIVIPVDFDFRDAPVKLESGFLNMHIHNESYKMENSCPVASKDQNDTLNVEMHLRVGYSYG